MRDNFYSNRSWIYINGELYHAGVKGMQWGKHLPGTDWWKESVNSYYKNNNIGYNSGGRVKDVDEKGRTTFRDANPTYGNNANFIQRAKANLYTAGKAAKIYGRKANLAGRILTKQAGAKIRKGAYRAVRGVSKFVQNAPAQLSEFARNAWSEARTNVRKYMFVGSGNRQKVDVNSSMSFLDVVQNKQLDDAVKAYKNGKVDGSVGSTINQFIQNAQYGIVKGINNYLKSMKMDDDVDRFFNKISGGKSRLSVNRYVKDNTVKKPSGPYNSAEQRADKKNEQNKKRTDSYNQQFTKDANDIGSTDYRRKKLYF